MLHQWLRTRIVYDNNRHSSCPGGMTLSVLPLSQRLEAANLGHSVPSAHNNIGVI